jgi:predicted methyltransferase
MSRSAAVILSLALALSPAAVLARPLPTPTPAATAVIAAAAYPARAGDKPLDARRHGPELMAFSKVKRGDKVLELIPGSGYFTRLFSQIVGPTGHVYAVWPQPYADEAVPDVNALKAASAKAPWTNVTVLVQPPAKLTAPEPLDLVFTSQNYHDYPDKFMGRIDPMVLNRAVFKLLKPGGVYVVIDHVAPAGSGLADTDTLHRIDPAIVKKQVTAAGFVFEGSSPLLRNPADPHTVLVFDKSIRGHTDQFVYRFRKPR